MKAKAAPARRARSSVSVVREEFFYTQDGVRLHYNVIGRGPALILCDGIGCDQYAWKYIVPFFQDRYSVVRWNYRGHGQSGTPPTLDRLSMDDVRADLDALIEREKLEDVVLVGHSMGVQVVLDYYAQHASKVRGMALVCGAPGRPLTTFHDSDVGDKIFPYIYSTVTRFPKYARKLWQKLVPTRLSYEIAVRTEVNGAFIKRQDFMPYFEHLASMDPVVFFTMLKHLNAHDVTSTLERIAVPTLIVAGEKDTFTPAWLSHKMHDKISGSELLFIPGGSHTAPIEFPELINLRLEKFLRERL